MTDDVLKKLSNKYTPRFAQLAVNKGFVSSEQVIQAVTEQLNDDLARKEHKLIGTIMMKKGWMTAKQVEEVLNEAFIKEEK